MVWRIYLSSEIKMRYLAIVYTVRVYIVYIGRSFIKFNILLYILCTSNEVTCPSTILVIYSYII